MQNLPKALQYSAIGSIVFCPHLLVYLLFYTLVHYSLTSTIIHPLFQILLLHFILSQNHLLIHLHLIPFLFSFVIIFSQKCSPICFSYSNPLFIFFPHYLHWNSLSLDSFARIFKYFGFQTYFFSAFWSRGVQLMFSFN